MKNLLFGLAILPYISAAGFAGQPIALSNEQMDAVVAGAAFETSGGLTISPAPGTSSGIGPQVWVFSLTETDVTNTSTVRVNVDPACNCYLNILSSALTVQAQFGPSPGVVNLFSFQAH
jgi:hypothetical protein